MPLHRDAERLVYLFRPFNDAVLRPRRRRQPRCKLLHRLMMVRVRHQRLSANDARKAALCIHPHGMRRDFRRLRLLVVNGGVRALRRQILNQ